MQTQQQEVKLHLFWKKNNSIFCNQVFTRLLPINQQQTPIMVRRKLVTACEKLVDTPYQKVKVRVTIKVNELVTFRKKLEQPEPQPLLITPINHPAQPDQLPVQMNGANERQFLQRVYIKQMQTIPSWIETDILDTENTTPVPIVIGTIRDLIEAQNSNDGRQIVYLLLHNVHFYDVLPTRIFIAEFNKVAKQYYLDKYGAESCPGSYCCLKTTHREIKFLSARRRPMFYNNILKRPKPKNNERDVEDANNLSFHLEYSAKHHPAKHNSVKQASIKCDVTYKRALRIVKKYGFRKFKIQSAPYLAPRHKLARLKFAREVLAKNKLTENDAYLKSIWYSDESHFALKSPNLKNLHHWGKVRPDCLEITQQSGSHVSVWAAVNAHHKSELIFIEKPKMGVKGPLYYKGVNGQRGLPKMENCTVNSEVYINMILTPYAAEMDRLGFIQNNKLLNAIYMQDG